MFVCLSVCVDICLTSCLSVYHSGCLAVFLSVCLPSYLSALLSLYSLSYLSVCLHLCTHTYLSVRTSIVEMNGEKTEKDFKRRMKGVGKRNRTFSSVQSLDRMGHLGNMVDDSAEILFHCFLQRQGCSILSRHWMCLWVGVLGRAVEPVKPV